MIISFFSKCLIELEIYSYRYWMETDVVTVWTEEALGVETVTLGQLERPRLGCRQLQDCSDDHHEEKDPMVNRP